MKTLLTASGTLLLLTACPKGDVGAPCNHGRIEPPESKLVTFPALSCNDLLCVYADEEEPPAEPCTDSVQCNSVDPSTDRFECVIAESGVGVCRLRIDYVLNRSMCSKRCGSNDDCKNGGPTKQVVVDDTSCSTGFACARIQTLGEFCCAKLCVCRDDLGVTTEIDQACAGNTQEGCCINVDEPSDECGKQ